MIDDNEIKRKVVKRYKELEASGKLDEYEKAAKQLSETAKKMIDGLNESDHLQVAREQSDAMAGLLDQIVRIVLPMIPDQTGIPDAMISIAKVLDVSYLLGRNFPTLNTEPVEYRKSVDGRTWFRLPTFEEFNPVDRVASKGAVMDAVELINGIREEEIKAAFGLIPHLVMGMGQLVAIIMDTLGPGGMTAQTIGQVIASVYILGQNAERTAKSAKLNDLLGDVNLGEP